MFKQLTQRLILIALIVSLLGCTAYAEGTASPADGLYTVGVTSSSDMFRVTKCVLHVKDGVLTATLTLSGQGYGYLFAGTGEQADKTPQSEWVPYVEDANGAYTYTIAIPGLDLDVSVAAYSTKYSKWYDRTLVFQSGGLRAYEVVPADGAYTLAAVSATLQTGDCVIRITGGVMNATLSLPGFSTLRLGEAEYKETDGAFTFPIDSLDKDIVLALYTEGGVREEHTLSFPSSALAGLSIVPDDGVYSITAKSDSNLFPIEDCRLSVVDGRMTAFVTAGNTKYSYLFAGLAKDALRAEENIKIPAITGDGDTFTYAVPVPSLDQPIAIATWSGKASKWYDRTLMLDSATLSPADDSVPSFAFTGGSGRVSITCPLVLAAGGRNVATIVFSSSNYTYAQCDGIKYFNQNPGGSSTFQIPVTLNGTTEIQAETVAMGDPRVIAYTLYLYTDGTDAAQAAGIAGPQSTQPPQTDVPGKSDISTPLNIAGLAYEKTLPLDFATCFAVHDYAGGYSVIRVADGRDYLTVPEGMPVPDGVGDSLVVLQQPLNRMYLAATSAMCLFESLNGLPHIRFSGSEAEDWFVEAAIQAMKSGDIVFAGKYSAPDYELLLAGGCDLAIESTMILHAPEAQEKLEALGIPVWVDVSSSEPEPLGRTEWIKVYGTLLGAQEAAQDAFDRQKAYIDELKVPEQSGLTVAYFYVNTSGQIVTKSPADYFARMVETAGGRYVTCGAPSGGDASSTITADMESYYAAAKDANFLVYNATVGEAPSSIADLTSIHAMFSDFKAVKDGNVWCTTKALYQSADQTGRIISDLNTMLRESAEDAGFVYKLH